MKLKDPNGGPIKLVNVKTSASNTQTPRGDRESLVDRLKERKSIEEEKVALNIDKN